VDEMEIETLRAELEADEIETGLFNVGLSTW